ncbi:VOC family protein [Thermogemmatispora sp.]|jgi:catechol 2,3-dioxygenase-like lactoylglutathione lyase family enzyme|uniref:VOC family protein n=1 Tax=Thermogemmatispora sp. TaxID=1968838 RepID=UPI0035E40721
MSRQPTLDFVVIHVADLEASFRYYTEKLGFTTEPSENSPGFRYLKGAPGGIDFGLMQASGGRQPGTIVLYLRTGDLEGLHQELLDKQVEVSAIMHPPFGDTFTLSAPNGELLAAWQPRS